jgi:hypothetical protein
MPTSTHLRPNIYQHGPNILGAKELAILRNTQQSHGPTCHSLPNADLHESLEFSAGLLA